MHELDRPIMWCTVHADEGSSRSRSTDESISNPIASLSTPDSAIALAPAIEAGSWTDVPSGHQRRSRTPARRSSKPGRVPSRS